MDKKNVDAISECADNGIIASVWRSKSNLGICFSEKGKTVTWDDMDLKKRCLFQRNGTAFQFIYLYIYHPLWQKRLSLLSEG